MVGKDNPLGGKVFVLQRILISAPKFLFPVLSKQHLEQGPFVLASFGRARAISSLFSLLARFKHLPSRLRGH